MRRHEVGGEEIGSISLALSSLYSHNGHLIRVPVLVAGKTENREIGFSVQMKRENQNPRCNPSFQPAIFFSLSFARPTRTRVYTLSLSLFLSLLLSFILRIIQPSERSHRLLRPVCLRKVGAPQPEILRVKKLHSTRQYVTKKKKMRRMRASEKDCIPIHRNNIFVSFLLPASLSPTISVSITSHGNK